MTYYINYGFKGESGSKKGIHIVKVYCDTLKSARFLAEINKPDDMYLIGLVSIEEAKTIEFRG